MTKINFGFLPAPQDDKQLLAYLRENFNRIQNLLGVYDLDKIVATETALATHKLTENADHGLEHNDLNAVGADDHHSDSHTHERHTTLYGARVEKTGTQNIITTATTVVSWDEVSTGDTFDPSSMLSTPNLVAPVDGVYFGVAHIELDTVSAGTTQIIVSTRKNGNADTTQDKTPSGGADFIAVPYVVELEVNDTLSVQVTCSNATGNSVIGVQSYLSMLLWGRE